jgi:hypothetical protein
MKESEMNAEAIGRRTSARQTKFRKAQVSRNAIFATMST